MAVNSFRKAGIVSFNKDAVSQTSLTHSVPYSASVVNDNNDDNADDSSRIDTTPADVLSLTDLLGNDVKEVIQTTINTAQPLFPTQNSLEPCTSTHCTPTKACPNTATLPTSDSNMPQHEQTPGPSQSQATEIGL